MKTLPPFLLAGTRFLIAGGLLYGWARWQEEAAPPAAVWGTAAFMGSLFFFLGSGLVVWAEQHVPSGRTALLASTSPLWTTVIESGRRGWRLPPGRALLGVGLGLAGLALLAVPHPSEPESSVPLVGAVGLLVSALAWSAGSVYSHVAHLPASPAMATGMKMLGGGAQLLLFGLATGEWTRLDPRHLSPGPVIAMLYLIVFGSIIGFTAFLYLLRVTTPARVATSSYVNPLVAVFLGWAFAGEMVTPRTLLAAAVIIGGVLLIRVGGEQRAEEEIPDASADMAG